MAPASMETSAATSMTRSSVVRGGGGGGGRGGGRSSSSSSVASVVSVASVASSSSSTTAAAHASHHHPHHSAHHSRDNASDKSSSSSDKQQGQGTSSSSDKQQALSSAEAQWLYNVAAVRDVLKDSLKVHIVKYVGDDDDDLYQYSYRQKHDGENQQPTDTLAVEATSPKKQQWAYASNSPTSRLVANLYSEDINNNARTSTPERRAARAIVGTTTTTATTTATTTTTTTTRPPPARRSTSPPPHPPQLYEMRTPVLNPLPACASEPLIHYKTGNGLAKGKTALPRGVNQGMQRQMYDEIGAPAATTYTAFHMPLPKTTLRDVEAKRRNTTTKQADIALKTQAREIMARQLRLSRAMRSAAEVLEYPLVRRTQPAGMVSLHPVPRLNSSRQSVHQAQRLCLVPTRRKITPPERGNAAGGGDLPLPVVRV